MTFQSPAMLIGLLLPAAAIVAYVVFQRVRRRYAVRFTNLDLLGSVVPKRARWRRHLPAALGFAATALLVVAVARPESWVHVHRRGAQVMLVTDISGSMQAKDVAPSRFSAARAAADAFLARLPKGDRVGAVAFNDRATTLTTPTLDHGAVRRALAGQEPLGGTATGDGIDAALKSLGTTGAHGGAIVLLSDGTANAGADPLEAARRAKAAGVRISTVALGTKGGVVELTDRHGRRKKSIPVPPDPAALRKIASVTGGRYVGARDAKGLLESYRRFGAEVGVAREHRELTAAFAGGALLLVLLGGGLSLVWFGRFP
jgi:Ca-activated chloride channel family protein